MPKLVPNSTTQNKCVLFTNVNNILGGREDALRCLLLHTLTGLSYKGRLVDPFTRSPALRYSIRKLDTASSMYRFVPATRHEDIAGEQTYTSTHS